MAEENGQKQSQKTIVLPLVVLAIVIAAAVAWRMMFYTPAPKMAAPVPPQIKMPAEANGLVSLPPTGEKPSVVVSKEVAAQPIVKAQVTMDDIIRVRQHWDPAFMDWVGKEAPDFDLADINGKGHKLSSYKGIPVMLIFWATWCPPCRMEIPGLVELRKTIPSDKLAIVAISYEQGDTVRGFLSQNPVNYIVIATPPNIMPPPYSQIEVLPTSFFLDKTGVIRLAVAGLVLPSEEQLILKALD